MKEHLKKVLDSISSRSELVLSSRKPLQKIKVVKEIKQYNPRFEEDYAQEKDYDVDRYIFISCKE